MRPLMRSVVVLASSLLPPVAARRSATRASSARTAARTAIGSATPPQKEGYCTIQGCDYSTCPDEAACIRFFTGGVRESRPATKSTDDCSLDELCDLNKHCVPRSSEVRYCMKTCESNDDCRDGYECRDLD